MRPLRRNIDLAVLALAACAIPALTSDRTRLPPALWVGIAVGVVLLLVSRLSGRPRLLPDGVIALAIGCASASAHLGSGIVHGHDTFDHVWGAWAWQQAWKAGDLLPIWLHHLGLGQPQPMFYGPLPFWAMSPFALAGGGTSSMLEGSFVLAGAAAGLFAWFAVASWTGDRRAALVAAAAWAFAPYRLLDANYRCAIDETWALALMPFVLHSFERLVVRRGFRRFRRAALATALLTLAHPISLVLLVVLLPAFWLVGTRLSRRGLRELAGAGLRVAGSGLAGLTLAGFFAIPLVVEARFLDLAPSTVNKTGLLYAQYGIHPAELVERRLWNGLEWAETEQEKLANGGREMPFYCGILLLAALPTAIFAARSGGAARAALLRLGVAGLVAMLFSLATTSHLVAHLPLLPILQFPWRFLGPASAAGALALGLLVARRDAASSSPHFLIVAGVALAVLADGFPFSGSVGRIGSWQGLAVYEQWVPGAQSPRPVPLPWSLRVAGGLLPPQGGRAEVGAARGVYREYSTLAARTLVKTGDPALFALGLEEDAGVVKRSAVAPYARLLRRHGRLAPLAFRRSGGRIEVATKGQMGEIEVAEQYFPGWQVEIDGEWREVVPSSRGLLDARAAAGQGLVRFRFDRWRADRISGWIASLLTLIGLAGGPRWRLRPRASRAR